MTVIHIYMHIPHFNRVLNSLYSNLRSSGVLRDVMWYHTMPHNNPEEHRFYQHRGGSLKSKHCTVNPLTYIPPCNDDIFKENEMRSRNIFILYLHKPKVV